MKIENILLEIIEMSCIKKLIRFSIEKRRFRFTETSQVKSENISFSKKLIFLSLSKKDGR
jgi:hypothetical protein